MHSSYDGELSKFSSREGECSIEIGKEVICLIRFQFEGLASFVSSEEGLQRDYIKDPQNWFDDS